MRDAEPLTLSILKQQAKGVAARIAGLTPSAKAYALLEWLAHHKQNLFLVCPTAEDAAQLEEDLNALIPLFSGAGLPSVKMTVIQDWEQSPYSTANPSIKTRISRIKGLMQVGRPCNQLQIVLTSLLASTQATIPPNVLFENTLCLRLNESVGNRETLALRLRQMGYLASDLVEDPGTFAIRGEILDLFPVHLEKPIRIELFDDLVERMRPFDPVSQRTLTSELKETLAPPAREILFLPQIVANLRERIKAHSDDQGIPRNIRDPLFESIQGLIYPDHADAWVPFAYPNPTTLWDYLKAASQPFTVIIDDELACKKNVLQFLEDHASLEPRAIQSGLIVPPLDRLYPWKSDLQNEIQSNVTLYFDPLLLQDPANPISCYRAIIDPIATGEKTSKTRLAEVTRSLRARMEEGYLIHAFAATQSQVARIRFLLGEHGIACGESPSPQQVAVHQGDLSEGFLWPTEKLLLVTELELLGTTQKRSSDRRRSDESAARNWAGLQALADLSVGDPVVHIKHGIGRYLGLVRLNLSGAPADFLQLEYANKDKLYLPIYRLNAIQKYMGGSEQVGLDRLGSQQFEKTKEKVRDAVKRLAFDLIELYAKRRLQKGNVLSIHDSTYQEFEAKFPFHETPDQLKAIDDTLADLESGRVMDRLVCGDVGYGKTEVAIRAAFATIQNGKQVAVLVPTTLLAHQHELSFKSRMADYPIQIESLSRFKVAKEQKSILQRLSEGKVDIVIGTHRLLSRDIRFKELGLVIVDEEHRFGVEHKEKLKTLKLNTHVLTLTATPIPRTLHMSLAGLRDISLITTPPVDRLPVRTSVSKFDEALIARAVRFELARGGQIFFLHNRVESIYEITNRLKEIIPEAKIAVGHAQMSEVELEKTMLNFYSRKIDVLVCTTIIESGLDIPTANTILINQADRLGLAQLYQLRGRVGRSNQRAYAYLLVSSPDRITEDAKRRLEVIQRFVELGSGFNIASHDLEIRGGGNLLGADQSGHIAAVGFDLYTELLEEAVHELQGKPAALDEMTADPEIKAPFAAFLDDRYVPDVHQRLIFYRRLSSAKNEDELRGLEEELTDRFGPMPEEAQNLLWVIRLKNLLRHAGIDALIAGSDKISLQPGKNNKIDPQKTVALIAKEPKKYAFASDSKLVIHFPTKNIKDMFLNLESQLNLLMTSATH